MNDVTRWAEKIQGCPAGKSWGVGDGVSRVTYVRRTNGEHAVHVGWLIPEAYSDDPGSISTPIKHFEGRSHMGRSAYYATVTDAIADFTAAAKDFRATPLPSAMRSNEFSTRAG